MNITMINGSEKKGSTYHIAQLFVDKLRDNNTQVTELFLPRDMPKFCIGCGNCFEKEARLCPHREKVKAAEQAMNQADLLIFTSPVYVYHVTGQMKTFLDHFGYRWMIHRPNALMFKKTALVISTAAGRGMKSTNQDIEDSTTFWGVAKTFTYGKAVAAINWNGVSEKKKQQIGLDINRMVPKIKKSVKKPVPCLKVKAMFYGMRFFLKRFSFNPPDYEYWKENGWLDNIRPWKN